MDYLMKISYIVVAVVGWIVAHYFTGRRDRNNNRRELVTRYLIEAYEVLCCEITQRPATDKRAKLIEDIVAKIQLVGTDTQIQLVHKLCDDICKKEEFSMDELINDMRNDLRINLGLSKVDTNVKWVRMGQKK